MNPINADDSYLLSDLASVSAGYPFRSSIEDLPTGAIAVIQMRNADPENGIDWKSLSRIELPRASAKTLLRPGDIILSTRGGRNFPYCIEDRAEHVVCSPHFFVIRVKKDAILPQFLTWQMSQKPAQDYFSAGSTGSYILNLRREVVERLPIAVPPMAEQRRIAELDEAARAERAILTRLIENRTAQMKVIAQRLLAPAFQRPEERST